MSLEKFSKLESLIWLRTNLSDHQEHSFGFSGLIKVSDDFLNHGSKLSGSFRETYYLSDNIAFHFDDPILNSQIFFSLNTEDIPNYFETIDKFIEQNIGSEVHDDFYIHEQRILCTNGCIEQSFPSYVDLCILVDLLKALAEYEDKSFNFSQFVLFGPNGVLKIDGGYNKHSLDLISSVGKIADFVKEFKEGPNFNTRKRLLINEISRCGIENIDQLIKIWKTLTANYKAGYDLFLAEFSLEEIKNSSLSYFHKLSDDIHSTIQKYSAFIFGIPLGYILLLRLFSFKGEEFTKDSLCMLIGILYYVLIRTALFGNLRSAFTSFEQDVNDLKKLLRAETSLKPIQDRIESDLSAVISKSNSRILISSRINNSIAAITLLAYIFIYFKALCYLLNSFVSFLFIILF